jgi:DnaJ like chaperone protein
MAYGKWIGGFLGWMVGGPIGGLIGFFVGSALEGESVQPLGYNHLYADEQQQAEGNRNSFLMSMLVLSSYIIKADGRIMHSEMELVRRWLRQNFGDMAAQQGDQILRQLFDEARSMGDYSFRQKIREGCQQIYMNTDYSQRLQLLNFLVMIAQADGRVDATEITALKEVAAWMQMPEMEIDSMLNLEKNDLESAYKVLGVSPEATDDELRRAYRRLALEHHPDRVASLGDDVRKAAEKKFQEINAAKERIWKARGL